MQETRSEARNQRVGGGLEERFQSATPTTRYHYIDVLFPEAGVDVAIEHPLLPARPDAVNFEVAQTNGPAHIYRNNAANARAWQQGTIFLRSNVANAKVRLLLSVPAEAESLPTFAGNGNLGGTILPGDLTVPGNLTVAGTSLLTGAVNIDGATDIDAALDVLGVVTTQAGINNTGGQIAFPANQVPSSGANVLDDYEEGLAANGASWTPVLSFGGATTGITYSARGGWYTKVGRIVRVVGRFALTSKGTATGAATISGLPFGAHTDTPVPSYAGEVGAAVVMANLTSPPSIRVNGGTTVIDLFDWGATGTVALDDTNFANTTVFTFSLTYLASA